ncbi:HTH domain-containing protein [Haloterrigena sp. SYSU A121-1]|uniref:HTH domain-containing protein n=1 Tax=Haloterrigena gelatinilytica TaxID=2741724 RepID=A0A8J8GMS4_9EURY|nr:HTH domain-containing protein [Haloterrigena gelatinilytica]NUB91162.1 HTH domain-containing protein [Haloterrigena gelatinilytica]
MGYKKFSENVLTSGEAVSRKQRILQILENEDRPVSTNTIADQLGVHWKTVADDLEELHEQGKVDRKELNNRLTLWWDREIQL